VPALSIVGFVLLAIISLAAIFAPLLTKWGPTEIDFNAFLVPPGTGGHLLGTDANGLDIYSRLLYGARVDLTIAVASVVAGAVIGGALGAISGFVGGWFDEISMRGMDIMQALPGFILALVVATLLGAGFVNLVIALTVVSAPSYMRLMRTEVRSMREESWVEASRAAGTSGLSILFRQIVPNSVRPILVIAPLACGWHILSLAGLSFVGLGVQLPDAEWGAMIAGSVGDLATGQWWTSVIPGLMLFVTVLAFSLASEGFQEGRR
jgi:peptide/nickel transport system permease protein